MPELPEVETVRRGLQQHIVGKKLSSVTVNWHKSLTNSQTELSAHVIGASVKSVERRAKVLMLRLSSGYTLLCHLKMTGQLVYRGKGSFGAGHPNDSLVGDLPDASTRVIFTFEDDSNLYFNDQRKFGWIKLLPDSEVPELGFIKKLGPEPLGDTFTEDIFIARMRRRNGATVKSALLDQTVVAGAGNIYTDESLWGAKIHPATRVRDISDKSLHTLCNELVGVLRLSIELGGSTDKNYVDAEGKKGSYLRFAKVFRREGQACLRCGSIIQKIRVAGRGTHVCNKCQKHKQ